MFDRFVGLAYRDGGRGFDGVDCYGLLWLVHRGNGRELPSYHAQYTLPADRKALDALVRSGLESWDEIAVGHEQPFDGVWMRDGERATHIGMVTRSGRLLHIERGITSCVEPYRHGRLRERVLGFYRYLGHE